MSKVATGNRQPEWVAKYHSVLNELFPFYSSVYIFVLLFHRHYIKYIPFEINCKTKICLNIHIYTVTIARAIRDKHWLCNYDFEIQSLVRAKQIWRTHESEGERERVRKGNTFIIGFFFFAVMRIDNKIAQLSTHTLAYQQTSYVQLRFIWFL